MITLFLRTSDYMGAGNNLIELAVENGQARPLDFFWKLVLTALTMRAGFRGGEIVPSFCIGATFGCIMGHLIGLSPSIWCSRRNGNPFLWRYQLPDHFHPDRI